MKQFSSVVAKIKNSDGKYESIPALRGMSSYEVAKEAGFSGTEQEWLEFMFDDGWVAKFQELETNKANKTDLDKYHTKDETLSNNAKDLLGLEHDATPDEAFMELHRLAITYQEPWNVDEKVGQINVVPGVVNASLSGDRTECEASIDIPMINGGDIYLLLSKSPSSIAYDGNYSYGNIILLKNGNEYGSYAWDDAPELIPFTVNKNDIITVKVIGKSGSTVGRNLGLSSIYLLANIETPYKYFSLREGTKAYIDSKDQIISALLGV